LITVELSGNCMTKLVKARLKHKAEYKADNR